MSANSKGPFDHTNYDYLIKQYKIINESESSKKLTINKITGEFETNSEQSSVMGRLYKTWISAGNAGTNWHDIAYNIELLAQKTKNLLSTAEFLSPTEIHELKGVIIIASEKLKQMASQISPSESDAESTFI